MGRSPGSRKRLANRLLHHDERTHHLDSVASLRWGRRFACPCKHARMSQEAAAFPAGRCLRLPHVAALAISPCRPARGNLPHAWSRFRSHRSLFGPPPLAMPLGEKNRSVPEPVGESDFSASRLPLVAVRNRSSHNISTRNVLLRQAPEPRQFSSLRRGRFPSLDEGERFSGNHGIFIAGTLTANSR